MALYIDTYFRVKATLLELNRFYQFMELCKFPNYENDYDPRILAKLLFPKAMTTYMDLDYGEKRIQSRVWKYLSYKHDNLTIKNHVYFDIIGSDKDHTQFHVEQKNDSFIRFIIRLSEMFPKIRFDVETSGEVERNEIIIIQNQKVLQYEYYDNWFQRGTYRFETEQSHLNFKESFMA